MSTHVWQKSSYSGEAANCVYVAAGDCRTVRMRESDDPSTVLTTTPEELAAFIRAAKAGEFGRFTEG
ncbi:DUF397 domain-containing protein [Streptomyces sp. TRM 70361]|uniref:DUF397 domain-containing protein n=1 Tax=Streptomyces sp. TRM 70361 TaxID=3116553 RepID=UPI002E7B4C0D|nr:DUF397 domain-containing protein [Streptomyces sp. TRM 70361]MEE1939362.1 DUF397 domain-containing protein [Streptomyces sp. TRM 70361]